MSSPAFRMEFGRKRILKKNALKWEGCYFCLSNIIAIFLDRISPYPFSSYHRRISTVLNHEYGHWATEPLCALLPKSKENEMSERFVTSFHLLCNKVLLSREKMSFSERLKERLPSCILLRLLRC